MAIIKLTQQFINNNLKCPEGRSRISFYYSDLKSFYLEVRATSPGQGTFYYQFRDQEGKTRHQKLGRTTEITLSEAIKQAKIFRAKAALARGEEKVKQTVMTYAEFFEHHYLPHKSPHKRSIEDDIRIFRLKLQPTLGHKLLHQITRIEIQALLTSYRQTRAPASCNHILKIIKHSLNLAVEWEFLESNPAVRIPLYPEYNKVENYLTDAELERLLAVLHTDKNRTVCQLGLFLLSTGLRLQEALSAKWVDVDLENKLLRVRAINSKSKRLRSVPLNESAIAVLYELDTQGHDAPLFLNKHTGRPYTTITKAWHRIRNKAGLNHLRLHDLRHQHASMLINSGRTLYEVQQILGHSDPKVTMRYAHLSTKTLQEASNCASAKIKAMQPKEASATES